MVSIASYFLGDRNRRRARSLKPAVANVKTGIMNPKKFFIVLCIVFFACSTAFSGQPSAAGSRLEELAQISGRFTFAVIGDTRSGEDTNEKLVKMVMEHEPALVINLGDVVRQPGSLFDWKRFKELSSPITVPYFSGCGQSRCGR